MGLYLSFSQHIHIVYHYAEMAWVTRDAYRLWSRRDAKYSEIEAWMSCIAFSLMEVGPDLAEGATTDPWNRERPFTRHRILPARKNRRIAEQEWELIKQAETRFEQLRLDVGRASRGRKRTPSREILPFLVPVLPDCEEILAYCLRAGHAPRTEDWRQSFANFPV